MTPVSRETSKSDLGNGRGDEPPGGQEPGGGAGGAVGRRGAGNAMPFRPILLRGPLIFHHGEGRVGGWLGDSDLGGQHSFPTVWSGDVAAARPGGSRMRAGEAFRVDGAPEAVAYRWARDVAPGRARHRRPARLGCPSSDRREVCGRMVSGSGMRMQPADSRHSAAFGIAIGVSARHASFHVKPWLSDSAGGGKVDADRWPCRYPALRNRGG